MTVYLGPPGNLRSMRHPKPGYSMPWQILGGTHQLLSGARVRDVVGRKRTIRLDWAWLSDAEYAPLEALVLGAYGPGPYVYVDPVQRNLLTPNVSTAGDPGGVNPTTLYGTATNGSLAGSISAATSANFVWQGSQSVRWDAPGALTTVAHGLITGAALASSGSVVTDTPVVAGASYAASVYARRGSSPDVPVSMSARIRWHDGSGAHVGTSFGSPAALDFTFQRLTVTGIAPAGATSARVALANTVTTSAAPSVFADGWQFHLAEAVSDWTLGTGTVRVVIDSFDRSVPLVGHHDVSMTLVEV